MRLAPHGIRVNAVRPGLAQGENSPVLPPAHLDSIAAAIPLGRMIQPGELSRAVLFLASEAASFTTGQVLSVDGGGGINRRAPT
ncbi:3-oxoacyl-[acyl-carrier-protein] reductase FabG [compost metagenome]